MNCLCASLACHFLAMQCRVSLSPVRSDHTELIELRNVISFHCHGGVVSLSCQFLSSPSSCEPM